MSLSFWGRFYHIWFMMTRQSSSVPVYLIILSYFLRKFMESALLEYFFSIIITGEILSNKKVSPIHAYINAVFWNFAKILFHKHLHITWSMSKKLWLQMYHTSLLYIKIDMCVNGYLFWTTQAIWIRNPKWFLQDYSFKMIFTTEMKSLMTQSHMMNYIIS